jgi:hypothetical protein
MDFKITANDFSVEIGNTPLTNLIYNAMDSLNYKYDGMYLDIEQSDDLIEESIKKELRKLK